MIKTLAALFALGALASASASNPAPVPVSSIDLPKYAGKWYQIADYPQIYELFCKHCTTANYTLLSNGHVGVENACRITAGSKPTVIHADATVPDPSKPAELIVKFFDGLSSGQYWVIGLGAVNKQNQYPWAVVSDSKRNSLYVLARTPTVDNSTQSDIMGVLKADGHFDLNKMKFTDQSGCGWASTTPVVGTDTSEMTSAFKAPQLSGNTVTLYKIEGAECGESTLDAAYAKAAEAFAGLKEGNCPDQGYTKETGTQTMEVPVIGKVVITKYVKPSNMVL